MSNEHMRIDKFDCEYKMTGDGQPFCHVHSHSIVIWPSRYGLEYGNNRPCIAEEDGGIWLFYEDHGYASDAANQRIILPYQMTFSLKGIIDIGVEQTETMRLAFIRNGMNVMAAIEEWEKK